MSIPYGEMAALVVWVGVTVAARDALRRFGAIQCRAGDWGLAFVVGYAVYTAVVFLGAVAGIPVSFAWYAAAAVLVVGTGLWLGRTAPPQPAQQTPRWTPTEIVLLLALAGYAVMVIEYGLFYPVGAIDAFSYDGRGKFMVIDGTLDMDLYHWPGTRFSGANNLTYPPLFSLALGLVYALGGWQTKIVTVGFALAWPLLVFGELRQHLPRAASLAWVLFLAITPELLSHASYALLNVPTMALTTATAILLARFLRTGRFRFAAFAAVTSAGAAGTRPDALVVIASLCAVAAVGIRFHAAGPGWKRGLAGLATIALAPLITWGVWTVYFMMAVDPVRMTPIQLTDTIGWASVLRAGRVLVTNFETYGLVFVVWAVGLLGWAVRRSRSRGAGLYHADALLILAALATLFSFLSLGYGGTTFDVLFSSFKRALFYVVPLAGMATALSAPWSTLARMGRGWIHDDPEVREIP